MNEKVFGKPGSLDSPTRLERPNGRARCEFWFVAQLVEAGYSRDALAAYAGSAEKPKWRSTFCALIGQAQRLY